MLLLCLQDWWRYESGDAVSRRVLMVALANVQSLLIKVADSVRQYSYRSVTPSAVD